MLALITLAAAALRLIQIGKVAAGPLLRRRRAQHGRCPGTTSSSAPSSPPGSVSIDKPPVDLWLQVASVKLFGFSSTTLKLPEALAGIAAVPLLYAPCGGMWSRLPGSPRPPRSRCCRSR